MDVVDVVSSDEGFTRLTEDIDAAVNAAFAEVNNYAKCFEPFRDVYAKNVEETAAEGLVEKYGDVELDVFRKNIAKFRGQSGQFSGIPTCSDIGIIRLDSSELKRRLLPSPD